MFRRKPAPPPNSDLDLVLRVANRDATALRMLFERYSGFAHAIASRVVSDHHLAEDIVQESFVTVWNKANQFDPARGGNVRAWILAIVNYRAIDAVRARKALHRNPTSIDTLEHVLGSEDAFMHIEAIELREMVREALQQLSSDQVTAIEMNILEGYSHREISEIQQVPIGTIKSRIRLGMQRLYHLLQLAQLEED